MNQKSVKDSPSLTDQKISLKYFEFLIFLFPISKAKVADEYKANGKLIPNDNAFS